MPEVITKDLICIVCPVGCKLTIEKRGDEFVVKGNACKRGEEYAIKEMTHPTRMLTSTVRLINSSHARLPVHSSAPLPKDLIFEAMKVINAAQAKTPVNVKQVIIKNILNTGVDICSSRTLE